MEHLSLGKLMDFQHIVDLLLGGFSALVMWILNSISGRLKQVEQRQAECPRMFALKEDLKEVKDNFRELVRDVKDALRRIEDKIDNKVDKA